MSLWIFDGVCGFVCESEVGHFHSETTSCRSFICEIPALYSHLFTSSRFQWSLTQIIALFPAQECFIGGLDSQRVSPLLSLNVISFLFCHPQPHVLYPL